MGDHYGLVLSNLFQEESEKYFRCWGTCIKLSYNIPRSSHRYIASYLASNFYSIRTNVISRFVKFIRSCFKSESQELAMVSKIAAHDKSSVTGINLYNISKETGLNSWTAKPNQVKRILQEKVNPSPANELWRLPFLEKLLSGSKLNMN